MRQRAHGREHARHWEAFHPAGERTKPIIAETLLKTRLGVSVGIGMPDKTQSVLDAPSSKGRSR